MLDHVLTTAVSPSQIMCLFNCKTETKPLETRTVHEKLLYFVDLYPKHIPNA